VGLELDGVVNHQCCRKQIYHLHSHLCRLDDELSQCHRGVKSAWTCRTRIEIPHPVTTAQRRAMSVPADDNLDTSSPGIDIQLEKVVEQVNPKPPVSTSSLCGSPDAQCGLSTLPRTTINGAIARSRSSTSGVPTSPACRIACDPCKALIASDRSKPCVSEMIPT
jgi:hypothetical protein